MNSLDQGFAQLDISQGHSLLTRMYKNTISSYLTAEHTQKVEDPHLEDFEQTAD